MRTKSYSSRTASSARLSLSSRLNAGTSSISAPARSMRGRGHEQVLEAGRLDAVVEGGRVVHEHVVDRALDVAGVDARARSMALPWGSRSTTRTRKPELGERRAEVHRGRGLAHAALLVGDRDDPGQLEQSRGRRGRRVRLGRRPVPGSFCRVRWRGGRHQGLRLGAPARAPVARLRLRCRCGGRGEGGGSGVGRRRCAVRARVGSGAGSGSGVGSGSARRFVGRDRSGRRSRRRLDGTWNSTAGSDAPEPVHCVGRARCRSVGHFLVRTPASEEPAARTRIAEFFRH